MPVVQLGIQQPVIAETGILIKEPGAETAIIPFGHGVQRTCPGHARFQLIVPGVLKLCAPIILAILVPIGIAVGLGVAFLEFQTWMILPIICFGLIAFVVAALVRSVITTYISASWTLAYREMTGVGTEEIVEVSSA